MLEQTVQNSNHSGRRNCCHRNSIHTRPNVPHQLTPHKCHTCTTTANPRTPSTTAHPTTPICSSRMRCITSTNVTSPSSTIPPSPSVLNTPLDSYPDSAHNANSDYLSPVYDSPVRASSKSDSSRCSTRASTTNSVASRLRKRMSNQSPQTPTNNYRIRLLHVAPPASHT